MKIKSYSKMNFKLRRLDRDYYDKNCFAKSLLLFEVHHFDYSILIHTTQLLSESVQQKNKQKNHECWKTIIFCTILEITLKVSVCLFSNSILYTN